MLNNCTKGVKELYTARKQQCPNRPPKGLALTTKDGKLTATLGTNVTFLVHLDEVSKHFLDFSLLCGMIYFYIKLHLQVLETNHVTDIIFVDYRCILCQNVKVLHDLS